MKNKTSIYYVSGMHCHACETLLERKLKKMDGVESVDASLADKAVTVESKKGHALSVSTLNEDFKELGYTFSTTPVGEGKLTIQHLLQAAVVAVIGIIAFIILDDMKVFSRFTLDERSTIPAFLALGVVASVSSCAALTGGLIISLSKQWVQLYGGVQESKRLFPVIMFNLGRIVSYTVLGGLLGLIGSYFRVSLTFSSILVIVVSFVMVILGLQMLGVAWAKKIRIALPRSISGFVSDEQKFQGKYMPFIVGALTFFLPCGFTLMAQTVALATGNVATSALMMLAFAVGTLPMLWFIGFSSVSFTQNKVFGQTFSTVAAVFIILFSIYNVNAQLNVLGLPSVNDVFAQESKPAESASGLGVTLVGEGENQYQDVKMLAKEFGYFPSSLTLKAGVPVKLTVKNENVLGCASAMYWPGIHDEVIFLQGPQTTAEFTPEKPGDYKVSCSMGMVRPVAVRVIN